MPQPCSFRGLFRTAALTAGLAVLSFAQDASMVLRTSVTYRTQRNSLTLSDEQRQQADQLARDASQAGNGGKYGEAIRAYYHGLAVMRGAAWTPAYEFASSLQGKLDHAIAAPGDTVTVTLTPLYKGADGIKLPASAALVVPQRNGVGGSEKVLVSDLKVESGALPFRAQVKLPADASGDYVFTVLLHVDGEVPSGARTGLVKTMPMHIEALSADAGKLRDRLNSVTAKNGTALASAQYVLDFYERADRGDANPAGFHFREEFARANEILDGIGAGKDPFAGKHGDFRKAYVSAVDHTLQPYRILVPESYDGSKPSALVVALHGMGGDENSMFDAYNGALKPAIEKAGMIAVCPKGRDSASMYRGTAEQDVMDVLAEVRRDYKIDPNRIYLMGHSMGGYGTWSVAMNHPEVWAALGPISGGGTPGGMAKIAHIPEYVVHGDADPTVPVTSSRTMVEAGKKAGANITYVEVPGGNHMTVVAPNFAPMVEFFAKQQKRPMPHLPRGTATDVSSEDVQATLKKTAGAAVSDQAIRVVSINDEYNVGVGVVHRAKTDGRTGGAIEHSQITEIYHVMEGNATLVTGGEIENPRESSPQSMVVKVLNGPSTGGAGVQSGVSRKIGPGDVVVIPPNTPHWFSEITSDQIVYLVVRVDPHKVLPAGYGAK